METQAQEDFVGNIVAIFMVLMMAIVPCVAFYSCIVHEHDCPDQDERER